MFSKNPNEVIEKAKNYEYNCLICTIRFRNKIVFDPKTTCINCKLIVCSDCFKSSKRQCISCHNILGATLKDWKVLENQRPFYAPLVFVTRIQLLEIEKMLRTREVKELKERVEELRKTLLEDKFAKKCTNRGDHAKTILKASKKGSLLALNNLIDSSSESFDPLVTNKKGQTALHLAVSNRKQDCVKQLVAEYPKMLNRRDEDGETALHKAVKSDKWLGITEILLNARAKLHIVDRKGKTPYELACEPIRLLILKYQNETIDSVLKIKDPTEFKQPFVTGRSINWQDSDGNSFLHHLCYDGNEAYVKYLLYNAGAKRLKISATNKFGHTALHITCCKDGATISHQNIIGMLLEHKIDKDAVDHYGFTALSLAVAYQNKEALQILIRFGCNVNHRASYRDFATPLHIAAYNKNVNIAQLLIQAGAEVTIRDFSRDIPLQIAEIRKAENPKATEQIQGMISNIGDRLLLLTVTKENDSKRLDRLLTEDINSRDLRDESHKSGLHYAVANGSLECVQVFLKYGANVHQVDKEGKSPVILARELAKAHGGKYIEISTLLESNQESGALMTAIQNNSPNEVERLIRNSNDTIFFGAKTLNGGHTFHEAASRGYDKILAIMLNKFTLNDSNRASYYERDNEGNTPLMVAVTKGHQECVILLLQFFEDINDINPITGDTPLHMAVSTKNTDLIIVLCNLDASLDAKNMRLQRPKHLVSYQIKDEFKVRLLLYWYSKGRKLISAAKAGDTNKAKMIVEIDAIIELIRMMESKEEDFKDITETDAVAVINECVQKMALIISSKQKNKNILDFFIQNLSGLVASDTPSYVSFQDPLCRTALHYAVENRNVSCISLLLQFHANIHTTDKESISPLSLAQTIGNQEIINMLLSHEKNIRLLTECRLGNQQNALNLLKQGADPKCIDSLKKTPLHRCAAHFSGCVRYLIEYGADVNALDIFNNTPLHLAAIGSNVESVTLLMSAGCDLFISRSGAQQNSQEKEIVSKNLYERFKAGKDIISQKIANLHRANEFMNSVKDITALTKKFNDMDLKDIQVILAIPLKDKRTVLHEAAEKQILDVVSLLLKYGADPTLTDCNGNTPLSIAQSKNPNSEMTKLLAKSVTLKRLKKCIVLNDSAELKRILHEPGFDINTPHELTGSTALHWASIQRKNTQCLEEILRSGRADVNRTDNQGQTVVHYVTWQGNLEALNIILDSSISTLQDVRDAEGYSPTLIALMNAQKEGCMDCYDLLVKMEHQSSNMSSSINQTDHNGRTPLMIAAARGNENLINILLQDPRCDINHKDNYGNTALIVACLGGHANCVKTLCSSNKKNHVINVDEQNNLKDSALLIACRTGNEQLAKILLDNGAYVLQKNNTGALPIHYAAYGGHKGCLELLLKSHAELQVNSEDKLHSPLAIAAAMGNSECISVLAQNGARLELLDLFDDDKPDNQENNLSAWHFCRDRKTDDILAYHITGCMYLKYADEGNLPKLKTVFQQRKYDPHYQRENDSKENGLHVAIRKGHTSIVKAILGNGIDLAKTCYDHDGILCNAIQLAQSVSVLNERKDIIKILNEHQKKMEIFDQIKKDKSASVSGFDLNVRDAKYQTILHRACEANLPHLCQEILDLDQEMAYTVNRNLETPLHVAVRAKSIDCVKILLPFDKGEFTEVNIDKESAFDLAYSSGQTEIVSSFIIHYNQKHGLEPPTLEPQLVGFTQSTKTIVVTKEIKAHFLSVEFDKKIAAKKARNEKEETMRKNELEKNASQLIAIYEQNINELQSNITRQRDDLEKKTKNMQEKMNTLKQFINYL
jgi:ankyrin repeat protein